MQIKGGSEIRSDFRLIAASNRDLDAMVQRRQFRKDLLFRLRVFTMELPPLRQRTEDIEDLMSVVDHLPTEHPKSLRHVTVSGQGHTAFVSIGLRQDAVHAAGTMGYKGLLACTSILMARL